MEDSGWKITEEDVSLSRQKVGGVIFVNILRSLRLGTRVGWGPNGRRGVCRTSEGVAENGGEEREREKRL